MSRCFPFPPPGYERKHKPGDLDLLKEAKRKEKKHKKDKERKKGKEKEKDGSDEKHRDKKDRKEKHKDKKEKHKDRKKDKEDRGKDKDKSNISEEFAVAGELEDKNGGNLQPKAHKCRSGFMDEGKSSILFQGQNGGKPSQSCLPFQSNDESKFVLELDRRIGDDQRGVGSQLRERVGVMDSKDQEMVSRGAIRNSSGLLVGEKLESKNMRVDRKFDYQGVKNGFSASTMAQNLMPITKLKVEGIAKPVDGQNGTKLEYGEKYKETGVLGQTKERAKMNDENAKFKNENKINSQFKDDRNNDPGGFTCKSTDLSKETNINAVNEENIRKRKEHTNGFLYESEIRPNKIQRPGPHQLKQNGRKLEPFQTPTKPSHDKLTIPDSVGVDDRERLMNGSIDSHKPSPPKPKPSTSTAEASKVARHDSPYVKVPNIEDLMAEASRRPPHPDSKYLTEVLTVPKMDWSELDDQDWLLSKEGPACKHKVVSMEDTNDQHVCSEAVYIESADVCALPYVIPY